MFIACNTGYEKRPSVVTEQNYYPETLSLLRLTDFLPLGGTEYIVQATWEVAGGPFQLQQQG